MIETIASVATALGIFFAGAGIWLSRRSLVAEFEQTFTARYRELSDHLPIEMLRGSAWSDRKLAEQEERACRLYLELCEDELYYRTHGRVSSSTWVDWWIGISNATSHPVLQQFIEKSQRSYALLRRAPNGAEDFHDPARSPIQRWLALRVWRRRAKVPMAKAH